jgi:hypothetical protein
MILTTAGPAALIAAATVDAIAGAAIWARRLDPLKTLLFAPEGRSGSVFDAPALTAPELRRICCIGLPLVADDLPPIEAAYSRSGLVEKLFVDNHYLHREFLGRLRALGVEMKVDARAVSATDRLLLHLRNPLPWETDLAKAVETGPAEAPEPWRGWLFTILAVYRDPFSIREAINPLIEERFDAFDPALRAVGEELWQESVEFAASQLHCVDIGGPVLAVFGLSRASGGDFRLFGDAVLRRENAQLALVFYDELDRLAIRSAPWAKPIVDAAGLAAAATDPLWKVYAYDRNTLFVERQDMEKLAVIEQTVEVLKLYFKNKQQSLDKQ